MSEAIAHAPAPHHVLAGGGRTPPSSLGALMRGPALAGYAVIGGFALVMAAWAMLAPLSSSAIAVGVVSPDGARRTVQHLEGGIVSRILVKDGDEVSAGQVLIEMDSTGAGAANEALQNQIFEAEAAEARLEAELSGAEVLIFPVVLQETAAAGTTAAKVLAGQRNIFEVRRQAGAKKRAILKARIAQIEEQIAGLRTERVALTRQAALVADRVTALQTLLSKGLVAKSSVIELQSRAAGLEGAIGQNGAAISAAEQAMGEAELEQEAAEIARLDEINGRLAGTRSALAELRERGKASADILSRTRIVAPADGRVMDLRIKTPGGVIGRGERILDIVPDSPDLIIEARVEPADIDDVVEGMSA
ncbi:MAG: HlyD family type I secretion periplasmic adaptor subunit [Micropepsaceae bacterium]